MQLRFLRAQFQTAPAALAAALFSTGNMTAQQSSNAEPLTVAFVLTEGSTMIDFAGPWEVFQDAIVDGREAYRLSTVGSSKSPIRTSGGMAVVPDHTFADAPKAEIIVIPAQRGAPELTDWLKKSYAGGSTIMSVCTGAFKLAATGLLDGKPATTHHEFFDKFEQQFPNVKLQRGLRFVKSGDRLFTAGGLTSGIDLALHLVDLRLGRAAAERTAEYMEYQGNGWKLPQK